MLNGRRDRVWCWGAAPLARKNKNAISLRKLNLRGDLVEQANSHPAGATNVVLAKNHSA